MRIGEYQIKCSGYIPGRDGERHPGRATLGELNIVGLISSLSWVVHTILYYHFLFLKYYKKYFETFKIKYFNVIIF